MTFFKDRRDAGRRLAERLVHLRDERPIVLGLPRGGVPVAYEVAKALGAPLDVLVVRKLGAPVQPELALGAVGPGGIRVVNDDAVAGLGVDAETLDRITERERREVDERTRRLRGDRPFPDVRGRTVVVVDNGIATGSTMLAAVAVLRRLGPRRIVAAAPVMPPDAVARFELAADEVVCIDAPEDFLAVGRWYEDFEQTTDEEVEGLLHAEAEAA